MYMLLVSNISVTSGSEVKEGTSMYMNCENVETGCKARTGQLCTVSWTARILDQPHTICTRQISVDSSDDSCFISGLTSVYTDRTTYQAGGVVYIQNVRRDESGTYRCECRCTGNTVDSKSYYGVIIVRMYQICKNVFV